MHVQAMNRPEAQRDLMMHAQERPMENLFCVMERKQESAVSGPPSPVLNISQCRPTDTLTRHYSLPTRSCELVSDRGPHAVRCADPALLPYCAVTAQCRGTNTKTTDAHLLASAITAIAELSPAGTLDTILLYHDPTVSRTYCTVGSFQRVIRPANADELPIDRAPPRPKGISYLLL